MGLAVNESGVLKDACDAKAAALEIVATADEYAMRSQDLDLQLRCGHKE
ncbi:MAG: hypothetical protein ACM309_07955 [Bacillota bacterium]